MIALTALEVMLSVDRKAADGPKISMEAAVSRMRSRMRFVVGGGGGIPFPALPAPLHAAMRHSVGLQGWDPVCGSLPSRPGTRQGEMVPYSGII